MNKNPFHPESIIQSFSREKLSLNALCLDRDGVILEENFPIRIEMFQPSLSISQSKFVLIYNGISYKGTN